MDIKKIIAKLPTGYVEEAARMDDATLREEVLRAETRIREVARDRASDEKLQGAKDIVKDLNGPYADAVKAQRAKIAFTLHTLEERGKLPEVGGGDGENEKTGVRRRPSTGRRRV